MEMCREVGAWEKILYNSPDIVSTIDRNGFVVNTNGACKKALGYEMEEVVGRHIKDFLHPEDLWFTQASIQEVVQGREVKDFENRYLHKEGAEVYFLWSAFWSEEDGIMLCIGRDITDRVKRSVKQQESEQRFKSLFEHHLDVAFFLGKNGKILDVNTAALAFFKVPKELVLNSLFSEFLPADSVQLCEKAFQSALAGERVRFEINIPLQGKGLCSFDVSKIPVIVNGEAIGAYCILRDISEISESNRVISRQAEKLNIIMESITEAFFNLDKNWNFTYVNQELEKLFCIDRQELLGKYFWDLADEGIKEELFVRYQEAVKTGKTAHFEVYLAKMDKWLQVKAFPSEEGLSVFMGDITARVNANLELEKLSLVASKTTNGVIISNAEGRIEWVNEGFEKLTGYSYSEVVGKFPGAILHKPEMHEALHSRISEKMNRGEVFAEEVINYKKSGEKVWFSLNIVPVRNEVGEVVRFVNIQTDITERKEAEEMQLQLAQDLFKQNRDMQQFTYIVSHNLRSPVAHARGLMEVLSAVEQDSDLFEESLAYLKASVYKLDTVLEDLNMILSIRDKKDILEKQTVNLASKCRQVMEDLQEPLQQCGGEVQLDVPENAEVSGNKAYLYSIFHNLLSNAIKYRSPKRALQVKISVSKSPDGTTVISFADNGTGFDMKQAGDNIFKLYKRFHAKSEGRGIGLFLVKTHLESMGGRIEVSSQPEVGTNFLIYLK